MPELLTNKIEILKCLLYSTLYLLTILTRTAVCYRWDHPAVTYEAWRVDTGKTVEKKFG